MRIGQVAELVGVSTRTVRHYHRVGVLPEPGRDPNGYRNYTLADVVALARARRLTELGLSLDEVADALSDQHDADLTEILASLDDDLARREQQIRDQRARLGDLRARLETEPDPWQSTGVRRMAEQLRDAGVAGPSAELDLQLMSLIPDDIADQAFGIGSPHDLGPVEQERLRDVYRRFDAVAGLEPDDPALAALADDIVAGLPDGLRAEAGQALRSSGDPSAQLAASPIGDVVGETLTPAQLAVMTAVMERLAR